MTIEREYGYIDKLLGFVSCEDREHAIHVANLHKAPAVVNIWRDGEIIKTVDLPCKDNRHK